MIEINKLDIEGLSNLGVGFETDEEMASFAAIVQDNLEVRVGDEMTKIMSPKQVNDFESIMGSGNEKVSKWLNENCPQHKEICQRVKKEMKNELMKYRDSIPGLCQSPTVCWNGKKLDELDELSVREFKMLKEKGVETLGELYALDKEEICKLLEVSGHRACAADRIKELLNFSRIQFGLCDDWIDDYYESYYDEELLVDDYPDEGFDEIKEPEKIIPHSQKRAASKR